MARLTKKAVVAMFREMWAECVGHDKTLRGDVIAKQQAWNDYTDGLCKDGTITNYQYNSWSNPF